MAFLWLITWATIPPVRDAVVSGMMQYDTANSTYGTFELADSFMNNLWRFLLVIVFVALIMFVAVYSQRKGEVMVMGR